MQKKKKKKFICNKESKTTAASLPYQLCYAARPYHLNKSAFSVRCFNFLTAFCLSVFLLASSVEPDQIAPSTASVLGLHCLHVSSKAGFQSRKGLVW